jgi:hypothetical protein
MPRAWEAMPMRPPAKGLHCKLEAEAVFADAVFLGHDHIIELQRMRIRTADAQFVFLGIDHKAGLALFHDQDIDAFVALFAVGLGNDQIGARCAAVGDPVFGAGQHIMVAFVDGRGFLLGGIRFRLQVR